MKKEKEEEEKDRATQVEPGVSAKSRMAAAAFVSSTRLTRLGRGLHSLARLIRKVFFLLSTKPGLTRDSRSQSEAEPSTSTHTSTYICPFYLSNERIGSTWCQIRLL